MGTHDHPSFVSESLAIKVDGSTYITVKIKFYNKFFLVCVHEEDGLDSFERR